MINKGQTIFLGASEETAPHNIKISNINDTSFIVSWITEKEATGQVAFGEGNLLNEKTNDLRDKDRAQQQKFLTHFVFIDGLLPETKYSLKIVSSGKAFGNGSKPYEVTTAPRSVPLDNDLAQGRIVSSNNQPEEGAIVYLTLPNTIIQAALTDKNGNWLIPLSVSRTTDLQSFSNYDRTAQIEEIFVQGKTQTASASVSTDNDNPVPEIKLGQTYIFQRQLSQTTPTPNPNITSNPLPTNNPATAGFVQDLSISSPKEKEEINTQIPEIFGTGPKGQILDISLEPETDNAKTTVDAKSEWRWSSLKTLSSGNHKIIVSYTDKNGFIKKVERNFKVLSVRNSDLPFFTATPSGQIISPTLTPSVTPKVTITGGVTPTTLSPTKAPEEPTPTLKARTTVPSGTPPSSGTGLPTWVFLGGGVTVFLIGIFFLFL